jgi:hypothetical protein
LLGTAPVVQPVILSSPNGSLRHVTRLAKAITRRQAADGLVVEYGGAGQTGATQRVRAEMPLILG